MWYDEAVVYQIYPLGLCGAPLQNSGDQTQAGEHRLLRVLDWVGHIKKLGATCVLFNPLFESDAHGYNTRDYNRVDCRLGTNDDLKQVTVDGEFVKLTPIEYNILLLLMKNQGKEFSINQIYESIWNEEAIGADNTVAVHIRHIREKIEINPKDPRYLKVVWGVGYKIEKA